MHSIRKFIAASALFAVATLGVAVPSLAQASFPGGQTSITPNFSYPAQAFTAAQTGTTIGLSGLNAGLFEVKATSLTAVTLAVQGSIDGGVTFFPLAYAPYAPTLTPVITSTLAAVPTTLFVVNLAGITNVRFVTSGTFTATGVTIKLTGSSNKGLL